MTCHETLLARKRKNASWSSSSTPLNPKHVSSSRRSSSSRYSSPSVSRSQSYDNHTTQSKRNTGSFKDKSLPSLPPGEFKPSKTSSKLYTSVPLPQSLSSSSFTSTSTGPVTSPPPRPAKQPPFDSSLTRGIVTRSQSNFKSITSVPTSRSASSSITHDYSSSNGSSSSGSAPIVSLSQSSPVYSLNTNGNGQNGTSTTLTETQSTSRRLSSLPLSNSGSTGHTSQHDWDHTTQNNTVNSNRSTEIENQQKGLHQPLGNLALRLDGNSLSFPQSSTRGGLYLGSSSTSSSYDEPPYVDFEVNPENPVPGESATHSVSPHSDVSLTSRQDDENSQNLSTSPTSSPLETIAKPKSVHAKDSAIPQISPFKSLEPEYNPYFPSKVAKQKTSPSAGHVDNTHLKPTFTLDPYSFEESILKDNTIWDLLKAKNRIAELEKKLQDTDDKTSSGSGGVDGNIQEKRKTIAGLEAKGEVARKELHMLEEARVRKNGLQDSSTDLVAAFTSEVSNVKSSLQAEIEKLLVYRDKLVEENTELAKNRDRTIEDISILNLKNNQLLDMFHELSRQAMDKDALQVKAQCFSKDGSRDLTKDKSSDNLSSVMSGIESSSYTSMSIASDEPLVTVLDGTAPDDKKDRQHARRFWKRPTAVVAKGVKGFNKVFAQENSNTISAGPYVDGDVKTVEIFSANNQNAVGSGGLGVASHNCAKEVHTKGTKNSNTNSNGNGSENTNSGMRNVNGGGTNSSRFKGHPPENPNNTGTSNGSNSHGTKPDSLLMGYPIEKRIQLENTVIPLIVRRCIQEVEARGMQFEGIYRKSGARSQVSAIEEAFEKSFDLADFKDVKNENEEGKNDTNSALPNGSNSTRGGVLSGDIAGVTSALKQYLRYLPNSLIHPDQYDNFVEAASLRHPDRSSSTSISSPSSSSTTTSSSFSTGNASLKLTTPPSSTAIEKLRLTINGLPSAYRDCLQCVMHHLSEITKYSDQNLMTSRNLAVCFAPTIVRHEDGARELQDMQARNDGTQLMIEYYSEIFGDCI